MHNRKQGQAKHYDDNGRIKFTKLSDLLQFFKSLYFYTDKAEDIFGFTKREIGFGADKVLLQGWLYLTNILSIFRTGPTSPAFKIFNDFFERLIGNLSPLSIIITSLQGLFLICKTIYVIAFSRDSHYTRAVQLATGVAAIGLIALSIAIFAGAVSVSAAVLFTVGAARSLAEHALIGFGFIYERFFSTRSNALSDRKAELTKKYIYDKAQFNKDDIKELTEISREQREGNEKILNKTQGAWLSTSFLVASVLLFTPLAPIGTTLLISLTAFAIADAILGVVTKQNTTRWIARGVNAFAGLFMEQRPFNLEVKTEHDIRIDLQRAEQKEIAKLGIHAINETRERIAMQNEGITKASPVITEKRKLSDEAGPSTPTALLYKTLATPAETRKGKEKDVDKEKENTHKVSQPIPIEQKEITVMTSQASQPLELATTTTRPTQPSIRIKPFQFQSQSQPSIGQLLNFGKNTLFNRTGRSMDSLLLQRQYMSIPVIPRPLSIKEDTYNETYSPKQN